MRSDIINRIAKVKGINYSDEQLAILNHTGGMVVVAGAGSGKTSTITDLIYVLISNGEVDPSRMLCTTYSKSGATEMNDKFRSLCKKMGSTQYNVTVKTLHAVYYQILKAFGYNLNMISEGDSIRFIKQAFKENGNLDPKDSELVDKVRSLISYQVNRVIDDNKLAQSIVFSDGEIKISDYTQVRNRFYELKRENNVIDFDDLQLQVYNLLYGFNGQYSDMIVQYIRNNWDFFIIDEFQDTSKVQYMILKKMVDNANSDRLIVIGDDDQAIYTWRGTDPNIILEDISIDYNVDKLVLPTNYRCGSEIVKFADSSIRHNSKRQYKDLRAFNNGGEVKIVKSSGNGLYEMSRDTADKIKDLILNGVPANEISILVRNNIQACIIQNMLTIDGIYTECMSDNQKFTKSQLYSDFLCAFDFCNDTLDKSMVKSNLWKFIPFLGTAGAKLVSDVMNDMGLSLRRAIGYIFYKSNGAIKEYIKDDFSYMKDNPKVEANIMYRYRMLKGESATSLYEFYKNLVDEERDTKDRVRELMGDLISSIEFLYRSPEKKRILIGYRKYFLSLLDKYSLEEIKDKLRNCEAIDNNDGGLLGAKVRISTLHGSKGLEWKYVFMLCCDSLCIPSISDISVMFDNGYSMKDIEEYIDCERRLYYVGCTRAKSNLYIVGNLDTPSPFLLESVGATTKDIGTDVNLALKLGLSSSRKGWDESFLRKHLELVKEFKRIREESYN